jgi:hypothetical protein
MPQFIAKHHDMFTSHRRIGVEDIAAAVQTARLLDVITGWIASAHRQSKSE